MKSMSFVIAAAGVALIGWMVFASPSALASVEDTSWGEVKSASQAYRAGKAAHHDTTSLSWSPEVAEIVGEWISRRFNEAEQLEEVHYVFRSDQTVTLTQQIEGSENPTPPLHGRWQLEESVTLYIDWEGASESTWVDVQLHRHHGEELLVLDYKDSKDKERRTLNQAASPPPPRNWLVHLTPDPPAGDLITPIKAGTWVGYDFEVLAADGHLPSYIRVHVEDGYALVDSLVHVLDKRAYTGSDGVPHVNLCYDSMVLNNQSPPRHLWNSDRDLYIHLEGEATGGFFITGCRTLVEPARALIQIFSPHASEYDEPLREFQVRIDY